jgi:hypothetical protein
MPPGLADVAMGHEALAQTYAVFLQQELVRTIVVDWPRTGLGAYSTPESHLPLTERNWSYRRGNNGAG